MARTIRKVPAYLIPHLDHYDESFIRKLKAGGVRYALNEKINHSQSFWPKDEGIRNPKFIRLRKRHLRRQMRRNLNRRMEEYV